MNIDLVRIEGCNINNIFQGEALEEEGFNEAILAIERAKYFVSQIKTKIPYNPDTNVLLCGLPFYNSLRKAYLGYMRGAVCNYYTINNITYHSNSLNNSDYILTEFIKYFPEVDYSVFTLFRSILEWRNIGLYHLPDLLNGRLKWVSIEKYTYRFMSRQLERYSDARLELLSAGREMGE